MKLKFDDLKIADKFKYGGREWQKVTQFAAKCLSKDAPFEADTMIAFDRKKEVELDESDPNTIFRKRG